MLFVNVLFVEKKSVLPTRLEPAIFSSRYHARLYMLFWHLFSLRLHIYIRICDLSEAATLTWALLQFNTHDGSSLSNNIDMGYHHHHIHEDRSSVFKLLQPTLLPPHVPTSLPHSTLPPTPALPSIHIRSIRSTSITSRNRKRSTESG